MFLEIGGDLVDTCGKSGERTCIGLDRALVPLKLLRDPSMSLMQASQVIGTANVVSKAGTVIVNAIQLSSTLVQKVRSSCVIDVIRSPRSL